MTAVTAGAALGTSPPAPTLAMGSDDDAGLIYLGTGTSTTTGLMCTVTLGANYMESVYPVQTAPKPSVLVGGQSVAAAGLGIHVRNVTAISFDIYCTVAPTASQAGTAIEIAYRTGI